MGFTLTSQCTLLLLKSHEDLDVDPFDVSPWNNEAWRTAAGLKPLRPGKHDRPPRGPSTGAATAPTEEGLIETATEEFDDDEMADISEGFMLREEVLKSLPRGERRYFTEERQALIRTFMVNMLDRRAKEKQEKEKLAEKLAEERRRVEEEEKSSAESEEDATPKKGKGKSRSKPKPKPKPKAKAKPRPKKSQVTKDDPGDLLVRVEFVPGYVAFRDALLSLLNRPGGVMDQIIEIMDRQCRTPAYAWRDKRQENENKPEKERVPEHTIPVPPSGAYIDMGLLGLLVAKHLFGAEGINGHTGVVKDSFHGTVAGLMRRCWENLKRRTATVIKHGWESKQAYMQALQDAKSRPSVNSLRCAARTLQEWKDLAEITGEADGAVFKKLKDELAELWKDLGFSGELGGGRAAKPKRGIPMASEEEMRNAYEHYVRLQFPPDEGQEDTAEAVFRAMEESLLPSTDSLVEVDLRGTGEDLGVAEFSNIQTEELRKLMGLATDQFPYGEPGSDGKPKVVPRWHQLVGTAAMLKAMYTKELGDAPSPSLLCDDVGLGKTIELVGTISMLTHLIELQDKKRPPPPFIQQNGTPYFAGRAEIPRLPSLIIVPRTLSDQWVKQFESFTQKGAFRILLYSKLKCDPEVLFRPGGEWDKIISSDCPHRTIVIAELPTLAREAKAFLQVPPGGAAGNKAKLSGEPAEILPTMDPRLSIFGKQFLLTAIDEVHTLRNVNNAYQAVLRLTANSAVRIGATATPIFTGAKDLAAQGRLLRHVPMIGEQGIELALEMKALVAGRTKQWKKDGTEILEELSRDMDKAKAGNDPPEKSAEDTEGRDVTDEEAKALKSFWIAIPSIDLARKRLGRIIIRRTGTSKQPDGKPVLELEPFVESIVYTPHRENEKKAIHIVCDRFEQSGDGNDALYFLNWRNFLVDQKSVAFDYRLARRRPPPDQPQDPDEDGPGGGMGGGNDTPNQSDNQDELRRFWLNWTAENVDEMCSTKQAAVVQLVEHHENPHAKPMFFNRDGSRDTAKEDALRNFRSVDRPRKFLIFIMYDIHREIMKTVLELKGRKCLEYDGRMSLAARKAAIENFEKDDEATILLISSVGTTGLNLTVASVVIFVSGLWSGQETKQTIGRVWRHGQIDPVVVYHVIAPNSVDEVLLGYANGKTLQMERFMLKNGLANKCFPEPLKDTSDECDEEDSPPALPAAKSRVKRRPPKQKPAARVSSVVPSSEPTVDSFDPSTPSQKRAATPIEGGDEQGEKRMRTNEAGTSINTTKVDQPVQPHVDQLDPPTVFEPRGYVGVHPAAHAALHPPVDNSLRPIGPKPPRPAAPAPLIVSKPPIVPGAGPSTAAAASPSEARPLLLPTDDAAQSAKSSSEATHRPIPRPNAENLAKQPIVKERTAGSRSQIMEIEPTSTRATEQSGSSSPSLETRRAPPPPELEIDLDMDSYIRWEPEEEENQAGIAKGGTQPSPQKVPAKAAAMPPPFGKNKSSAKFCTLPAVRSQSSSSSAPQQSRVRSAGQASAASPSAASYTPQGARKPRTFKDSTKASSTSSSSGRELLAKRTTVVVEREDRNAQLGLVRPLSPPRRPSSSLKRDAYSAGWRGSKGTVVGEPIGEQSDEGLSKRSKNH